MAELTELFCPCSIEATQECPLVSFCQPIRTWEPPTSPEYIVGPRGTGQPGNAKCEEESTYIYLNLLTV